MDQKNSITKAWQLYEQGKLYNSRLTPNQYNLVETNTEFFAGNQWLNLSRTAASADLQKPVFNILKRIASLFIASLTSSGVTMNFEPLAYYDGSNQADPDHDASRFANAEIENILEKLKFDYRVRDALFDGAVSGDYCAHFYYDPDAVPYGGAFGAYRGEIQMELVDGINVMFGNPNSKDVEKQPYIIIVGRDTIEHLAWEAERFRKNKDVYKSGTANKDSGDLLRSSITTDAENWNMPGVGGKVEITNGDGSDKALYVYLYTKVSKEVDLIDPRTGEPMQEDVLDKDGNPVYEDDLLDAQGNPVPKRRNAKTIETSVHVTKATRSAIIFEDVDTGLTRYPIAWGNWERQKNQYHGRALVTGMVPNQIFINRMFASAMRHMEQMAFPKYVYDADKISRWDNRVGQAIGVHGLLPGQTIPQVATVIQPAEMSAQIFAMIDKVMSYTKDCLGATDAQMGNVRPDNTSALMVLQTNAEVPLENIRANLYEWVEDVGAILLDMMGTYYGNRPVVIDREFDEMVTDAGDVPQIDPMTGTFRTQKVVRKTVESFDFSQFKHLWLNLRVDVGATTYFSEIAMTQTLDNLRRDGVLDAIQYLERIPDKLIPKKQELIDELKSKMTDMQQMGAPTQDQGAAAPLQGGALSEDKATGALPDGIEGMMDELPDVAKRAAKKQGELRAAKR